MLNPALPAAVPAPGVLPPGLRIYVIGDVHGCADRLDALHAAIAADLALRPVARAELVHLGDYVDRGPDSAGVIAMLLRGPASPARGTAAFAGVRVINLMGNHEQMMLAALANVEAAPLWLANGGEASLRSWGVPPGIPRATWQDHIPPEHLAFLRGLPLTHRAGSYFFAHAGVDPQRPLERQIPDDLLWIREPFLSWGGDLGAVVVHGHTPERAPVVRPNRIGLDTGAVMGGRLTCGVLEGRTIAFLQA